MFKQIANNIFKTTHMSPLRELVRYKRQYIKKKLTSNPGIQHRVELLKDRHEDEFDVDEIESAEADFMNVGSSHKDHIRELHKFKDREKVLIVKQKYFKQKYPNFLTWNDKQQIQYLHRTNAEEWTIEKLSDGFPALPETIKKIVKNNWSKSASQIENHDNSVKRNWTLFKQGQLNLPPILIEHLSKFTNRKYNISSQNTINEKSTRTLIPKIDGEFSEIIKSYQRLKNNDGLIKEDEESLVKPEHEHKRTNKGTYVLDNDLSRDKNTTLESFKDTLKWKDSLGETLDEDDKLILTESNTSSISEQTVSENPIIDLRDISRTAYVSTNNKTEKDLSFLNYPEKILIPKDKLKPGYTYKLNDCYYDSDGLFLYRVPGMDK